MFHNTKNPKTEGRPKKEIALTMAMNNEAPKLRQYISSHHMYVRENDVWNPNRISGGISFNIVSDVVGFNLGVGYKMLGVNLTVPVVWGSYVTMNAGAMSGAEAILQKPILDKRFKSLGFGLAEGVYARYDLIYFDEETVIKYDGFASYGIRSVIQIAGLPDGFIHGFLSLGYAPKLKHSLIFMGVALGYP